MKMLNFVFVMFLLIGSVMSGSITGQVVDHNGDPIPNAEVSIPTANQLTYTVDLLPGNSYSFVDYTITYASGDASTSSADLSIVYPDLSGGTLSITCHTDANSPCDLQTYYSGHLVINLTSFDTSTLKISLSLSYYPTSFTDSSGWFRIPGLDDGDHVLDVSASGYQESTVGPIPIDNSDPSKTDRTLPIPIVLYLSGGNGVGWISGRVVDTSGNPLDGCTVELLDTGDNVVNTTSTGTDGRFNLTITESGTFSIVVSKDGYHSTRVNGIVVDVNDPYSDHYILPDDIVLSQLGPTTSLSGYVYDTDGNPVPGAEVRVEDVSTGSQVGTDITGSDGYYEVSGIEVGLPINVYVNATGYSSTGITNLVLPSSGLEYNFTLHQTGTTPVSYPASVHGYVYDDDGNPLEGATVSAAGVSNHTDSSGYYHLTITNGTWTITVSLSGYENGYSTVSVEPYQDVEVNFTLNEESSGGGSGGGGGSGSSGGSGGGSHGGTTGGEETEESSSGTGVESQGTYFWMDGCKVLVEHVVSQTDDTTYVNLTLATVNCSTGEFLLTEHPPTGLSNNFVGASPEPMNVTQDPLTLTWRVEGLEAGRSKTFRFWFNRTGDWIGPEDFYISVNKITEVSTPTVVSVIVSKHAFINDTLKIKVVDEEGKPLGDITVVVHTPKGYVVRLKTNDHGYAVYTPKVPGRYTYTIDDPDYILKTIVSTEVLTPVEIPEETPSNLSEPESYNITANLTENQTGQEENWFNTLVGSGDVSLWGIIGVLILAIIGILFYAWQTHTGIFEGEDGSEGSGSDGGDEGGGDSLKEKVSEKTILIEASEPRSRTTRTTRKSRKTATRSKNKQ